MAFYNSGSGGRGKPFKPHAHGTHQRKAPVTGPRDRSSHRRHDGAAARVRDMTAPVVRSRSEGRAGEGPRPGQ